MSVVQDIKILDIKFLEASHVIANYLIPSGDGPILVETGPETTFEHLKKAIAGAGYHWKDIKHVLLTHIHFDHAGAAWKFAQNGAQIYVHPKGLPHLHQPERLWNSAKRIYKEDMDRLWGTMEPIEKKLLVPVKDGDIVAIGGKEFRAHYTPGHAIHHNAYQLDSVIFTGDVAGVRINNGPAVPPCPPPDIDVASWKKSIQKLKNLNSERLYIAHFGVVEHPNRHLQELEEMLDDWVSWMYPYFKNDADPEQITPKFVNYTQQQLRDQGLAEEDVQRYEKGNPSFMSVTGLMRYWKLKTQGRLE